MRPDAPSAGRSTICRSTWSRKSSKRSKTRPSACPTFRCRADLQNSEFRILNSESPLMPLDGLLVVDKPVGPTSHDIVSRVRRVLRERRIGHTGTLDPLASGVLLLVVGRATRLARFLTADAKRY